MVKNIGSERVVIELQTGIQPMFSNYNKVAGKYTDKVTGANSYSHSDTALISLLELHIMKIKNKIIMFLVCTYLEVTQRLFR